MKGMTLDKIAAVTAGELHLCKEWAEHPECMDREASCVVIDSRLPVEGGIFVATRGERVDGHSFIDGVWHKGAMCVVCEDKPSDDGGNYILVKDSFKALKDMAAYYMSGLTVKTVGIVGSVGKTSTKEIVASVLSRHYNTLKTEGNFNNQVGVPLSVFRIKEEHEVAVLEMGINDFGEMDSLGKIVRPDICIMTNIGPCHLENLGDLDGVLKAKSEVFKYIKPDGSVILNGDDEKLKELKNVEGKTPLFYGRDSGFEAFAKSEDSLGLKGTRITIAYEKGEFSVTVPLPGVHMVDNALAAALVGLELGLSEEEIREGIESMTAMPGRTNLVKTDHFLVIDDCYNASPKPVKAAIDLLLTAEGRKVAFLGDMLELGEDSDKLHEEVGEYAAKSGIDLLLLSGKEAKHMYDGATKANPKLEIYYEETLEKLLRLLREAPVLKEGDTILVKASHGMKYSKVIDFLQKK